MITKLLAFITFFITEPHSGAVVEVRTDHPTECVEQGDRIRAELEAAGFVADYECDYTNAPATSMRPRARPIQIET